MGRNVGGVGGVGAVLKGLVNNDDEGKLLNLANVLSPLFAILHNFNLDIFLNFLSDATYV